MTDTTLSEDCADGVDNDANGLVDCEDAACADLVMCVESSCADGLDEDLDGFIDCEDADCWGSDGPCGTSIATIQAASSAHIYWRGTYHRYTTSAGGCDARSSEDGSVTLAQPSGTVRLQLAGAIDWTTCAWSAVSSVAPISEAQYMGLWSVDQVSIQVDRPMLVQRAGFNLDPGCPLQDDDVLAKWWTVDPDLLGYRIRGGTTPLLGPMLWSVGSPTTHSSWHFGSGALDCIHVESYKTSASFGTVTGGEGYGH